MNTARRAFVALLLAVCPLGLLACGGEDPNALIKETFGSSKEVRSGNLTVSVNARAQGGPPQAQQPFTVRLTGPFQSQGKGKLPKFDMALAVNAAGQAIDAGLTSTGNAAFIKLQGQAYSVRDDIFSQIRTGYLQAQQQADAQKQSQTNSLASLGVDPSQWLTEPKVEGSEEVGGADTEHVTAKVNVARMLDDVNRGVTKARQRGGPQAAALPPGGITPEQRRQIQEAVRNVQFDFWTGSDDKILRKLDVKADLQVPPNLRANAQGLTGGQVGFVFQVAGLNEPQQVAAPANPQPFESLVSAIQSSPLGGLLGGLGAAGAGGGAGPPAGAGSNPAANQAFIQCVQQAGGDQARLAQCQAMLGR